MLLKEELSGDFPGGPLVDSTHPLQGDLGFIPGRGTKIPHATWCGQKKNKKQFSGYIVYCILG